MLDVPDVTLHTSFHLPEFTGLATETSHLGPAGDAWLYKMAHHVPVYQFLILLGMSQHVRPWSHNAHVAYKDVPELWQFVDVGLAHKIAKGELARIVLGSLQTVGIAIYMHGAELITIEIMAVDSCTQLAEEHRSRTLPFYRQYDERQKQSCGYQAHDR